MKKFNLRRIKIISLIVIMSVCFATIKNEERKNVISTMAVPVTNKVIIIDAGHGGEDEGDCLLTLIDNLILYSKIKCLDTLFFLDIIKIKKVLGK